MWPLVVVTALLSLMAQIVQAKSVFAHFMVSNTGDYTLADWTDDMRLAMEAKIDAFAMNMAYNETTSGASLDMAFAAAESLGFQLFFSFDYAGNGAWPQSAVIDMLTRHSGSKAYFRRGGQPLVSTFEGSDNAADWKNIKAATGCYFVPDWSSIGAESAVALGVADGLFNWAAWPVGKRKMNTFVDASYLQFLNGKTYMMPVSPWFFTNMPGYNKNWLWRGDDLWFDRWQQVHGIQLQMNVTDQPEFVQIISWNDYGESHYIGPLRGGAAYRAFDVGTAPYNYVSDMPHDGWRLFLPYLIDIYKTGTANIGHEGLVTWYRIHPSGVCNDGMTTGDTASHLHPEYPPQDIVQDKIFFSALLSSEDSVSVTLGGKTLSAQWTSKPAGGVGIYHGSADTGGGTGNVVVSLGRVGAINGQDITSTCTKGIQNWNAWVGKLQGEAKTASPALPLDKQACAHGLSVKDFQPLCNFTCSYGYCPISACQCDQFGPLVDWPHDYHPVGYPAAGRDANYLGLCAAACAHGFCPEGVCSSTQSDVGIAKLSPFVPDACTLGTGSGNLKGLCEYGCQYGFCPMHSCQCSTQGYLKVPPPIKKGLGGVNLPGLDPLIYKDLCNFACSRGEFCPEDVCQSLGGGNVVYIDPIIYSTPSPTVHCEGACTLVLPPSPLPSGSSTIYSFEPWTVPLEIGWQDGNQFVTTTG
jgi:hypothetical protein